MVTLKEYKDSIISQFEVRGIHVDTHDAVFITLVTLHFFELKEVDDRLNKLEETQNNKKEKMENLRRYNELLKLRCANEGSTYDEYLLEFVGEILNVLEGAINGV